MASLSPSPSPSPTAPGTIATVRVATGSRETRHELPVAASVLDAQALRDSPQASGDGALSAMPGFDRDRSNSGFTNYGQLRVSFTGAGNDRGLVLVDGIPAQDAFGGQIDWAAYPASDLRRAELLRGPGSALYGSGAIGGVLQLTTYGPTVATPRTGAFEFSLANHDGVRDDANAALPLSRHITASLSLAAQQFRYQDLPPGFSSAIDTPALSTSQMASVRIRYAPEPGTSLEYGYRAAWDSQQEGRPNYDFARHLDQHDLIYTLARGRNTIDAVGYVRDALISNRADAYPHAPGSLRYTQNIPTDESGVSLQWRMRSIRSELAVRADERAVRGTSDQYGPTGVVQATGSGAQTLAGIAVQETVHAQRAELVAGARADAVSLIGSHVDRAISPRVALRYDLNRRLAFRVSEGAGFRAPFLNELLRGYQIGNVVYRPNDALIPERSSSLSLGLDWSGTRTHVALDAIHTLVNDAISFRTITPILHVRSNFTRTQTDGETLDISHNFSPLARLHLFATTQYARVSGGTGVTIGKRLPYVPSVEANAALDAKVGVTETGVTLSYSGPTFADDLNLQPLGTALRLGIHLALPLRDGARAVIDVDNATDARYLTSVDRYAPPSTVWLAISIPAF